MSIFADFLSCCIVTFTWMTKYPRDHQTYLQRISDFLVDNHSWWQENQSGKIKFYQSTWIDCSMEIILDTSVTKVTPSSSKIPSTPSHLKATPMTSTPLYPPPEILPTESPVTSSTFSALIFLAIFI